MNNEEKIKAVQWFQSQGRIHPLTCQEHSNISLTPVIISNNVVLECPLCNYTQIYIPAVVLEMYEQRKELDF